MKYQPLTLTYLGVATSAIQGVNPGMGKAFPHISDGADARSSTTAAYEVDE